MARLFTTTLVTPIAVAALSLSLSGCGGSSSTTTASSASSASSTSSASSESSAPSASTSVSATAEAGTLAAACSQLDAVMEADPDADPAGTAMKLEDIKTQVTTPDADLIEALAAAYTAIAADPTGPTEALSSSAKALGAACQSATTAPRPN